MRNVLHIPLVNGVNGVGQALEDGKYEAALHILVLVIQGHAVHLKTREGRGR